MHYLNTTLVNDTVIVTKPPILIYEPQQDGSMKFVGVEYIIPYSIHGADQPAPVLLGEAFSKNDHFQLWGLHAWVGRKNPSRHVRNVESRRQLPVRARAVTRSSHDAARARVAPSHRWPPSLM